MFTFLAAPENLVFVSALVLMLLIGGLQLIGVGDFGVDPDVDAGGDAQLDLLGWLGFGRVPLLVLLVVFLALFGTLGLLLQLLLRDLAGGTLSGWIAVPGVAVASLPLTGLAARGLARILPGDHSTAVALEDLVGRPAQIVTGRARHGSPARARAEDPFGQAHFVMVEPNTSDAVFEEGETVLLVRREADLFRAVSSGDFYLPRLEG